MPRKIAMIGTTGSGNYAPYADLSFEIWGVSARASYVTRATRWFEMHRLDGEPPDWADSWRKALKGFSSDIGELLMLYPEPDLAPKVTRYPDKRICERFGTYFMTSTFAWMMALAIDEMAPQGTMAEPGSEIAIFGVDMEYGTEYRQQRAGFRHFIEVAKQLGIAVTRLANGGLVYEPVPYPLWQDDPLLAKLEKRQNEMKQKLAERDKTLRLTRSMIAENAALIEAVESGKMPEIEHLKKERERLLETSAAISKEVVAAQAVREEQQWFLDYLQS